MKKRIPIVGSFKNSKVTYTCSDDTCERFERYNCWIVLIGPDSDQPEIVSDTDFKKYKWAFEDYSIIARYHTYNDAYNAVHKYFEEHPYWLLCKSAWTYFVLKYTAGVYTKYVGPDESVIGTYITKREAITECDRLNSLLN